MWSPFCTSVLRNQACLFDTKAKKCGCCLSHIRCECTRPWYTHPTPPPQFNRSMLPHLYLDKTVSLFLCSLKVGRSKEFRMFRCGNCSLVWCILSSYQNQGEILSGAALLHFPMLCGVFMSVAGDGLCRGCLRNSSACGEEGLRSLTVLWTQTALTPGNTLTWGSRWPPWITFAMAGQSVVTSSV